MRDARALFLCLLAAACGGAPGEEHAGGQEERAPTPPAPRTVLVVVLDGAPVERMSCFGAAPATTPALEALVPEAYVFEEALTPATGTNAALASLLTGERPRTHGLQSLRDRGQHRLAPSAQTLAERLAAAGFRTYAAFSLPQLAPAVSGLGQGFERVDAPALDEDARDARQTFHHARSALAPLLAQDAPVFALVHFADARLAGAAPGAAGARFLAGELAPFTAGNAALAHALAAAERDPAGALAQLAQLLGRGRGSAAHAAWQRALLDGRLAFADEHLGALLELLRASGRLDSACIAVAGTRGGLVAAPAGATRGFLEALVRVPLVLRFPGGAPRGRSAALAQTIDLAPTLAELCGLEARVTDGASLLAHALGGGAPRTCAVVASTGLERRAAFGPTLALEESAVAGGSLLYERAGTQPLRGPPPGSEQEHDALRAALAASYLPERLVVEHAGEGAVELEWSFLGGHLRGVLLEGGEGTRTGAGAGTHGGRARLDAPRARLELVQSRRELALDLVLTTEGELDEERILAGDLPLARLLLPRLPLAGAEAWPSAGEGAEAWRADFDHLQGDWWRLAVPGPPFPAGAEVEALLVLHPPGRLDEELRAVAGAGVELVPVPGRGDLVRARGAAPFTLDVEKAPSRRIALAVAVEGRVVPARQVRYRGMRMGSARSLALHIPDWIAGVTDALQRAPEGERALAPGELRFSRSGTGLAPADRAGLAREELRALRFLGADE